MDKLVFKVSCPDTPEFFYFPMFTNPVDFALIVALEGVESRDLKVIGEPHEIQMIDWVADVRAERKEFFIEYCKMLGYQLILGEGQDAKQDMEE